MDYIKICDRYNEIRRTNTYEETVTQLAKEFFYSKDYMKRVVGKAFKNTDRIMEICKNRRRVWREDTNINNYSTNIIGLQ